MKKVFVRGKEINEIVDAVKNEDEAKELIKFAVETAQEMYYELEETESMSFDFWFDCEDEEVGVNCDEWYTPDNIKQILSKMDKHASLALIIEDDENDCERNNFGCFGIYSIDVDKEGELFLEEDDGPSSETLMNAISKKLCK